MSDDPKRAAAEAAAKAFEAAVCGALRGMGHEVGDRAKWYRDGWMVDGVASGFSACEQMTSGYRSHATGFVEVSYTTPTGRRTIAPKSPDAQEIARRVSEFVAHEKAAQAERDAAQSRHTNASGRAAAIVGRVGLPDGCRLLACDDGTLRFRADFTVTDAQAERVLTAIRDAMGEP